MKRSVAVFLSLAVLLTVLVVPAGAADKAAALSQAAALKQLGLFVGVSDNDFALDRAPTRAEAIIMLVRVLGREAEAKSGSWFHPFTDVDAWADKYIGYAYEKGLTFGVSADRFGKGSANSDMYMTFMLRALGYDDKAGEFSWSEPDTLAKSAGILTEDVNTDAFMRADVVLVSWAALDAEIKDENRTLSDKLTEDGVFTAETYEKAKTTAATVTEASDGSETTVKTADELKTALANPKVTTVVIGSNIDFTGELEIEREDDWSLRIGAGVTLTVSGTLIPVNCAIICDGTLIIKGTFEYGLGNFTNNGTVTVKKGGTAGSGMTNFNNNGTYTVESGGSLHIERGTQFHNYGSLANGGTISVADGGCLFAETGTITNNGTINIDSYFEGDLKAIKGSGKVNDRRSK